MISEIQTDSILVVCKIKTSYYIYRMGRSYYFWKNYLIRQSAMTSGDSQESNNCRYNFIRTRVVLSGGDQDNNIIVTLFYKNSFCRIIPHYFSKSRYSKKNLLFFHDFWPVCFVLLRPSVSFTIFQDIIHKHMLYVCISWFVLSFHFAELGAAARNVGNVPVNVMTQGHMS